MHEPGQTIVLMFLPGGAYSNSDNTTVEYHRRVTASVWYAMCASGERGDSYMLRHN